MRDAPPPGCSAAAAAHRPRGLPAGRSRVRGMSVGRRRRPRGSWARSLRRGARAAARAGGLERSRETPPPEDPQKSPGRGAGSRTEPGEARSPGCRQQGDPCREGREDGRPGAPWRLRGTPARGRVAGAFPGLGARRLSAWHAVTAGDVSASPRGGDARRGWFLGEPRALPIKLQQEAKSKSQSPSLPTERHPISWEPGSRAE